MQKDLLFRQEAIEAQKAPSLGVIRLATPVSYQIWTLAAIGMVVAILAWLFAGQYTRREHVAGSLVPQAGLLTLTARSAGTVTSVAIADGTAVHAGEALLTVSDDRSSASMGNTSVVISAQLRQQQARLQADLADTQHLANEQADDLRMQQHMLANQIRQVDAQLAIEQRQVGNLSVLLHRLQALGTQGYVSALEIQQQRTQQLDAKGQIKSLARQRLESEQQLKRIVDQLAQLPLTTATKLNDLHNQLAQNQQLLAQNETDRAAVMRAPKDGLVSSVLIQPGQTVTMGQPLLAIVPQGSLLEAQLLVPSSAVGFVHIGTPVVLHYQAFPYEKFGVQHGTVASISRSALTPSEITTLVGQQPPPEALYRVKVELAAQNIEAYGQTVSLKPGMVLGADLLLDRRRMIEWIFEPLYGMGHRLTGNG